MTAGPPRLTAGADALVERAQALSAGGRRSLLGIVGPPGAGKSTLADALRERLGDAVAVVGMDGFHLAQDELVRLGRAERKGAPDTFDAFGYAALLRRLREPEGVAVYAPAFRREIEEPVAGAVCVGPDVQLIITEGNYLLLDEPGWRDARDALDEVWYLEPAEELRVERLVARHRAFGRADDAARAWVAAVDEPNARLVCTTRERADLVVTLTG